MTIFSIAFSQDEDKRGSIKVKKIASDTNCTATILGFSGRNFISRKELLKAEKIELNKNCNRKITDCMYSFIVNQGSYRYAFNGEKFNGKEVFKQIQEKVDNEKVVTIKIKIIVTNKNTNEEIKLSPIIFDLTD